MTLGPNNSQTSYLPPEVDFIVNDEISNELMAKRHRLLATVVNIKENAQYEKREVLTGQQFFSAVQSGAIKTSYTYRLSFDLVALNGGPIPVGSTTFTLTATTSPAAISVPTGIQPIHGFGGAKNATTCYFINDPLVFVRTNIWTTGSQTITITNNTGATLTQCVWVFEYIKS
jgi:hypothetical protein